MSGANKNPMQMAPSAFSSSGPAEPVGPLAEKLLESHRLMGEPIPVPPGFQFEVPVKGTVTRRIQTMRQRAKELNALADEMERLNRER